MKAEESNNERKIPKHVVINMIPKVKQKFPFIVILQFEIL